MRSQSPLILAKQNPATCLLGPEPVSIIELGSTLVICAVDGVSAVSAALDLDLILISEQDQHRLW